MAIPVPGRRPCHVEPTVPLGLRCLLAGLAVSLLASGSPGREEALRLAVRTTEAPQDLGGGLTLRYERAEGYILFRGINSENPFDLPADQEFRALLRDRCNESTLASLIARGVVVQESRSFGPQQVHVFTLTMSQASCDQVAM